jgi:hypothetical protein
MLVCCECERRLAETATGWQGYLADLDDDGLDEVAFFCPGCAAREFGKAPAPSPWALSAHSIACAPAGVSADQPVPPHPV